jgi:uncharacterized protein YjbI with pentapeptide repeats
MSEKETSRPAHGCVLAVVGFQLIVILLALGLVASAYVHDPGAVLIWQYRLGKRDFRAVDLQRSSLSLQGVVLAGADLSGVDLESTDLRRANLSGANLSGVDLTWAKLNRANLAGANLTGADLNVADLRGADLSGAIVTASELDATRLLEGAILPDGTKWECAAKDYDLCRSKLEELD